MVRTRRHRRIRSYAADAACARGQRQSRRSTGRRGDKKPFVDQAGATEGIDKARGQGVDSFAEQQLDAILDGCGLEARPSS